MRIWIMRIRIQEVKIAYKAPKSWRNFLKKIYTLNLNLFYQIKYCKSVKKILYFQVIFVWNLFI